MCGISGYVGSSDGLEGSDLLKEILDSQHRRGPDRTASLCWRVPNVPQDVHLGHNRLSIIDLSEGGNQPMTSEDGRYSLVFNGAIYNYKEIRSTLETEGVIFESESDTEVLLKSFMAWGVDAIRRYYGMFSFCVLDRVDQVLTLVRDRFGVKPLFYLNDEKSFAFASTPSAIAKHFNLEPQLEYIGRGIRQKYYEDETEITPYVGLKSLPSAHYMTVSLKNLEINVHRYYDLDKEAAEQREVLSTISFDRAKKELLDHLKRAISLRLRADVPIGISLSGGVDSTSV